MKRRSVIVLMLCSLTLSLGAVDPQRIQEGNAHYEAGAYEEALTAYQAAGADDDGAPAELLHDAAAACFKLGRFEDARDYWVRAATRKDQPFEARMRFNLGNANYAEALQRLSAQDEGQSPDREAVIDLLNRATQQYEDAIGLDSSLTSARANLELARNLLRELEKEEAPQSQPQSQPSSQPQSQPESQPESQPQSQPESQSCSQPQSGDQEQQQQQQGQQEQQQPQEGEQQQQSGDEQQSQQAQGDQQQSEQDATGEEEGKPLTKEQAERLLKMVRELDRQRREQLKQRELREWLKGAKDRPVERDW